jgi:hypothetical protein
MAPVYTRLVQLGGEPGMTEFEFLSVLISMIFGLGLTHALAGTMRYVYVGRATEQRLVYSLFALVVRRFLT